MKALHKALQEGLQEWELEWGRLVPGRTHTQVSGHSNAAGHLV